jgi:hypothetical protein
MSVIVGSKQLSLVKWWRSESIWGNSESSFLLLLTLMHDLVSKLDPLAGRAVYKTTALLLLSGLTSIYSPMFTVCTT